MKFPNTRYISNIDISINTLGFSQLNKIAQIVEFCSALQYILFIWKFFSNIFHFLGIQNQVHLEILNLNVYVLVGITISLLGKLTAFYVLYKIQTSLLSKKIGYLILILSEECLFFLDIFLVYYSKDCLKELQLDLGIVVLSIINLLLCLVLKIINHILAVNYTYISQNPYKRRQNFIDYILKQLFLFLIIIQVQINDPIIIYSILSTISIFILFQFRYQVVTIPYTFHTISYIKLIKVSSVFSVFITSIFSLYFTLFAQNQFLFFFVLLFFIVYAAQSFRLLKKQNLLNLKIEEMENSEESSIKLQNYHSLLTDTNKQSIVKLMGYLNKHQNQCLNIDCICKKKQILQNISMARMISKEKEEKIFAKYILLQLSYDNKEKFSYTLESQMLYVSCLALLHLYPKMFTEIILTQQKYQQEISFTDTNMLDFLKIKISKDILQRNKNNNSACIEEVKYYEIKLSQLRQMIGGYCKNKCRTWISLYKGNLDIRFFEEYLKIDIKGRQSIIKLYQQLIQITYSSKLWRIMITFTKLVVRDVILERQLLNGIKKATEKLQNIQINGRIISLIENPNVALLKVSSELKNIGTITWCSSNLYSIFGFSTQYKVVGQNVDILMPKIFKLEHTNIMKKWFQNPTQNKKVNKFTEIYVSTYTNQYKRAITYIKILPLLDSFELISAIYSFNEQQQTLILNQNLDLINNPIFMNDILNKKGLSLKQKLDISLISSDFIEYCNNNIQNQEKHKISLCIKLPKDYDQIYILYKKAYDNILKEAQQKKISYERIKSLKLYYNSIIQMRKQTIELMLDIQIHKEKVGPTIYYFLKYIECDLIISVRNIQKNRLSITNFSIINTNSDVSVAENNSDILLFDQNKSYCSMTSQLSTIKMKKYIGLGQLQSRNLQIIKIVAGITFFSLVICVIFRLIFLSMNIMVYNDICSADSSVSDSMQLSEFIYDYSIILYSQSHKRRLSDQDIIFYSNQSIFVQNFILNLAQRDNLNQINKNFLSNINVQQYLHQFLKIKIQLSNITINNNIFLKQWVINARKLLLWDKQDKTVENQLKFMSENFGELMRMNHHLIYKYQDLGSIALDIISNFNNIMYPIQLLIAIMFIIYLNIYLVRKNQIKIEFLNIFIQIPEAKISNYASYFQICQQKFDTLTESDFQHLKTNKNTQNTKKVLPFKNINTQDNIKYSIFIFFTLIIWSTVSTINTKLFNYPAYYGLTYMNNIMDSQNYLIQGLIKFRQILLNITDDSVGNLNKINQSIYQVQVIFLNAAVNIQNLVQLYLPEKKFTLLSIYINDTCQVDSDILLDWQQVNCQNLDSPILSSGTLSTMNFFQRILAESLILLRNNSTLETKQNLLKNHDLIIADKTMFYLFRIYQKIQEVVLQLIQNQSNYLLNIIIIMTIMGLISLFCLLLVAVKFFINQYNEYRQTCKYLLCIPDEQYRENKQIQLALNRIFKIYCLDPKID